MSNIVLSMSLISHKRTKKMVKITNLKERLPWGVLSKIADKNKSTPFTDPGHQPQPLDIQKFLSNNTNE